MQVGQVPGRHEPDSHGEINFQFLFNHLETAGYDKWIGCEYNPRGELSAALLAASKHAQLLFIISRNKQSSLASHAHFSKCERGMVFETQNSHCQEFCYWSD